MSLAAAVIGGAIMLSASFVMAACILASTIDRAATRIAVFQRFNATLSYAHIPAFPFNTQPEVKDDHRRTQGREQG